MLLHVSMNARNGTTRFEMDRSTPWCVKDRSGALVMDLWKLAICIGRCLPPIETRRPRKNGSCVSWYIQ